VNRLIPLLVILWFAAGPLSAAAAAGAPTAEGVPIRIQLPTDGPLPRTYRVTVAITDAKDPDRLYSTFVSGAVRTVDASNKGAFTERWDGLDDNFMPLPPGEYAVKGIAMPAKKWEVDGEYHTITPRFLNGGDCWLPPPGDSRPIPVQGDPCNACFHDIDVGADGIAVFYHEYLENGRNAFVVDLTKPVGYDQVRAHHGSGGAAGGTSVCTDGVTVWAFGDAGANGKVPFIYRVDGKPFGDDASSYRTRVHATEGHVVSMAAAPTAKGSYVYYARASGGVVVLDGSDEHAGVKATIDLAKPVAITVRDGRLYALHGDRQVSALALKDGLPDGAWKPLCRIAQADAPADLVVDGKGRLYVSDTRANQVWQFDATGKMLRAFGKRTTPVGGRYDSTSFIAPGKLAAWTDDRGKDRLIVIEMAGPCRISEWGEDGAMIRDWLPAQTRANFGWCIDPTKPDIAYVSGSGNNLVDKGWLNRFQIDAKTGTWRCESAWPGVSSTFGPGARYDEYHFNRVYHLDGRTYMAYSGTGAIYRLHKERWVKSAGILNDGKGYLAWHDADGDGEVQAGECVDAKVPPGYANYWRQNFLEDMAFGVVGQGTPDCWRLPISGYDQHGNPIYDPAKWEKLFTDPYFAARSERRASALDGGNELDDRYSVAWARLVGTPESGFWVVARGGPGDANRSYQDKISHYVRGSDGTYRMKWRTGRVSLGGYKVGEMVASMWLSQPINGVLCVTDNTRAGFHLFAADSGLYLDTLMLDGGSQGKTLFGFPGEWWAGHASPHPDGIVRLVAGKAQPLLFAADGWTTSGQLWKPLEVLDRKVSLTAAQTASAPEMALRLRGGADQAVAATFSPATGGDPALDGSMDGWDATAPIRFQGDEKRTVEVRCMYQPETIWLRWHVRVGGTLAPRPLEPIERIFTHDRAADTVSFEIQGDLSAAAPTGREGRPGDARIVFGVFADGGSVKPVALGMHPHWKGANANPVTYGSPVGKAVFAHVAPVEGAKLGYAIDSDNQGFVIAAAIPRRSIPGLPSFADGLRTQVDFEATFGGQLRCWWANADLSANRTTNDEPTEAHLYPGAWTQAHFVPLGRTISVHHWQVIGPFGGAGLKAYPFDEPHPKPKANAFAHAFFTQAAYPVDGGKVDLQAVYTGDPTLDAHGAAHELRWRPMTVGDSFAEFTSLQAGFAATWIKAPEACSLRLRLPEQGWGVLSRGWLDGTELANANHTVTEQSITLTPGWHSLVLRMASISASPRFGVRLEGEPELLWRLRDANKPPK
jgi:hypothetical protein